MEYFNAYYIEDLKREINFCKLKNIIIIWHDPLIEKRVDSIKFSEVFTSIFSDQLLHIISILKRLGISADELKLTNLITSKDSRIIELISLYKNVEIKFSISRFSKQRERKIIINDSLELDFTKEPLLKKNNELKPQIIKKGKRLMPIAKTLEMFLNINSKNNNRPLSIDSLIPEIKYCFKCQDLFLNKIEMEINTIKDQIYVAKVGLPRYAYFLGIKYYELNFIDKNSTIHFY